MSVIDPIGDMITRIRNAYKSKLVSVEMSSSFEKKKVLDVLISEGYVRNYSVTKVGAFEMLEVFLRYSSSGDSALVEIKRVSKPGKRMYSTLSELKPCYNGMGVYVVSTSKGIVSDAVARSLGVGGELICKVF
jgi:small subunit ribosomal protein S8